MVTPVGDVGTLLAGGERALHVHGDLQASRKWFDAAFRAAELDGDGDAMAEAALGLGGLWVHEQRGTADDALLQARLRRALDAVDPESSLARRLTIRIAAETDYLRGENTTILAAAAEADGVGDVTAWTEALSLAHHCSLGPAHAELRKVLAQSLIAASSWTARRSDLLMGMLWRTVNEFLDADPHAERCLTELRGLLSEEANLALAFVVDAIEVMLSIRAGEFELAEKQAAMCAERGQAAGDADAAGWFNAQMINIRWYQGRIAELVPALRDALKSPSLNTVDSVLVAALAAAAATAGDHRQATSALARLGGPDIGRLPQTSGWLVSIYGIVEAANVLEDVDLAQTAYDLLTPVGHRPMMASLGVACFGSVQHALGVAALTTGDTVLAVDHFRAAIHDNLAIGHWPAVALSRVRLAQALDLRADPGDRDEAERERELAGQEAADLGIILLGSNAKIDTPGVRTPLACERRGQKWRIRLGHRHADIDHGIGMVYLCTLIGNPGSEISAVELAAGPGLPGPAAAEAAASSNHPVLDDMAKREYQRRLSELNADLDEFEAMNEPVRAARVRSERDWLIAELTSAAGLRGRVRQFAGNEERARIAVGKAIRRAMLRVAAADPVIEAELRATIHTGVRCCYRPR